MMMNDTPLFLLIAEIAGPFILLSIYLSFILFKKNNKTEKAIKALIEQNKQNEIEQKEQLETFLKKNFALESESLSIQSKKMMKKRKRLLRHIIASFLNHDLERIVLLNDDIQAMCHQYHQLEAVLLKESQTSDEDINENQEQTENTNPNKDENLELEQLKEEKKKSELIIENLHQDVSMTLTTLNTLFHEFSGMFGETVSDDNLSLEQIITAMASLSNKNTSNKEASKNSSKEKKSSSQTSNKENETLDFTAIEKKLDDTINPKKESSQKDNVQSEDIDNALDQLEIEGEPDWGDAFAESGDVMEVDEAN
jgi:hypothetical protein